MTIAELKHTVIKSVLGINNQPFLLKAFVMEHFQFLFLTFVWASFSFLSALWKFEIKIDCKDFMNGKCVKI